MVFGLSNKPNNSAIRQKLKSPAHFEILTKFTFLGCFGHFLPQNGEKRHFEHTFLLYSEMGVSLLSVGPPRTKSMVFGLSNKPNNSAIRQKLKSLAQFEILTKSVFLGCFSLFFGHFLSFFAFFAIFGPKTTKNNTFQHRITSRVFIRFTSH